jgi:hypothetical protein
MPVSLSWRGALAVVVVLAAGLGGVMAATASAFPGPPSATLFVNNGPTVPGRGDYWRDGEWYRHADSSCATAAFTTIGAAVSAATIPGSTIIVCPGTYNEGVLINKRLVLSGWGAVINASSSPFGNGVQIVGPGGSGSTVAGFKIENAEFEGILVGTAPVAPTNTTGTQQASGTPVSDVTIADNTLVNNDTGSTSGSFGQCVTPPGVPPADCGQSLHLVSVTDSIVEGNYAAYNDGGILLTDEFGPTANNIVRDNTTVNNTDDCGITLASHATGALPVSLAVNSAGLSAGLPDPAAAGVYDNLIENNISNNNGLLGQGAGILLGGGAPFSGVYSNVIRGNFASGNGLAGVTIHQHFVGDLNNNVVEDNILSNDNIDGDSDFATADTETTGVLVASGTPPGVPEFLWPGAPPTTTGEITGTIIRDNLIYGVKVGIWTLNVDPTSTTTTPNLYGPGVVTQVSTNTNPSIIYP